MSTQTRYPYNNPLPDISMSPVVAGIETPVIHALLCSTDHGILMTDHRGNDVLCNPRFGELFDIDPDLVVRSTREEVRRIALERVKDPHAFQTLLEEIYADPNIERQDEIELTGDPSRVLQRYTGPVLNSAGENIGRVWTFKDISETKRLQAEVQSYADRLTAQIEKQSADLAATSDVLAAMTAISAAIASRAEVPELCRRLTEITAGLLGQTCALLMVTDDHLGPLSTLCFSGQAPQPCDFCPNYDSVLIETAVTADTRDRLLIVHLNHKGPLAELVQSPSLAIAPLSWLGQPMGAIVFAGDVWQSPAHEQYRDHLEAVVTQIALALRIYRGRVDLQNAYDSLRIAQEQVVQSAKLNAVGTLAASVAHDVRNILTSLRLELAMARELGDAAGAQVDRLSALTHRLLALASPGDAHFSPVDLHDVMGSVLTIVKPQADVDGIVVKTRIAKQLPPICGDSSRLEHLFINLFLNAVNAMQAKGGTLTVTVTEAAGEVGIEVKDTGRGIAAENLERIFEPFFTTRANGSGLGLFSAKRIVEEHHGRLTVKSELGNGSCFTVTLPVRGGC